jgi:hypothetical protein
MRGSSIRLWSWRVCSSWLTSSQDFTSTMPESTMAFSTPGTSCRNRVTWSWGAEAHDPFDIAAVVPAAVDDHDLALAGRCCMYRCRYVCDCSRSVGAGRATARNTRGL